MVDLVTAARAVHDAQHLYDQVTEQLEAYRAQQADAVTQLETAQQNMEEALRDMVKRAPNGTGWWLKSPFVKGA